MKYKKVFPHIFLAILVGVFVLFSFSSPNSEVDQAGETAKVLRVIDGDTIEVGLNGKKETVRLIGIDSPEVLDERKPVECFGKKASNEAKEVLIGKTITLESDPTQGERDKYGRFLRYVFFDDLNFNKFMISEGYAYEYTYQNNPYKYMEEFKNAQKQARENKKGLWAEGICE